MTPFRVLLADDHALVRAGIRSLVEQVPGAQVVAETGDGHQTLKTLAESPPDVLLLDIGLPGLNGLEVADRVHRERPGIRVVMLSMHAGEEYVIGALRAGAAGYLLKDASVPELELALKAVLRGEIYLSPALSRQVIEGYMRRLDGETGPAALLTPRQREILQLIAEGHCTKEIAHRLEVSVKTVETHRAQLMERLGIYDIAGLVRYSIRARLIPPDR